MIPLLNLGKFIPSVLDDKVIAEEFSRWLTARHIKPNGEVPVRLPEDHIKLSQTDKIITQFHRDGLGKRATNPNPSLVPSVKWMLVWSNRSSTVFLLNGKEVIFEPFDVLLVDNHVVQHKAPPPEPERFFIRLLDPKFPEAWLK